MEIDGVERAKRKEISRGKKGERVKEAGAAFGNVMDKVTEDGKRKELDGLMSELEEQGKRLVQRNSSEEVKRYREIVGKFLGIVLGESYRIEESHSVTREGKFRSHTKIEKIENGLDELTRTVIEDQLEPMKVLAKVDEIKGLLFDLYK